jgi:Mg-chelatase subunit ChlD
MVHAVSACEHLLDNFIRPAIDQVAIIDCGNTARIESDFGATLAESRAALRSLISANTREQTRLWQSVMDASTAFWRAGRRNAAWVMIVVTDGGDTFKIDPVLAGQYLRHRFTFEPSNYLAVVGVGEDKAIDRAALDTFARAAGGSSFAIRDFSLLEALFQTIALRITTGLTPVHYTLGNLSWTEVQRVRNLSHGPVDLMLVLDRSGSMYSATK